MARPDRRQPGPSTDACLNDAAVQAHDPQPFGLEYEHGLTAPNHCTKRLVQKWESGEHSACRPDYLRVL